MSEPMGSRRAIQQSQKPPRGCHIFLVVILLAICLIAFFGLKGIFFPSQKAVTKSERKTILFWTLGGSETQGYGAAVSFSWPTKIEPYFEKKFSGANLSVINSSIPDANSSEGLGIVRSFLDKYQPAQAEGEQTPPDLRKPDFALICFGINNRWNLQSGSFASWPSEDLVDPQLRGVATAMKVKEPVQLTRIPRKQYYKHLEEEGWNVFFDSFENPFLSKWIQSDLTAMIDLIRASGIEPVLLTYYNDRFLDLNNSIRQIGLDTNTTVLDLETPLQYFAANHMILYQDPEDPLEIQINPEGYDYIARRVVDQFAKAYPQASLP